MNIAQAKEIPLEEVLQRQGFEPVEQRKGGRELWYLSPLRDERTPSFAIDTQLNIWNDFGEIGKGNQQTAGGKIIDYMMIYHRTDAKGALAQVNRLFNSNTPKVEKRSRILTKEPKDNPLKLVSAKAIFSQALIDYLEERKVNINIARKYLKQIQFQHEEKKTKGFALGFPNRKDGYELRNKFFKGVVGTKDISIIPGVQIGTNVQLIEGFFDFLSLLTIYNKERPQSDVILLNGSGQIGEAINYIKQTNYLSAQTWFDNDEGGKKALSNLKDAFKDRNLNIVPQNKKYQGFNDVNDMLTNQPHWKRTHPKI